MNRKGNPTGGVQPIGALPDGTPVFEGDVLRWDTGAITLACPFAAGCRVWTNCTLYAPGPRTDRRA